MKKIDDTDKMTASGLFLGSEPLQDVRHRSAAQKDVGDDGKDGLPDGDDDAGDTDEGDADGTDKSDTGDADGKD